MSCRCDLILRLTNQQRLVHDNLLSEPTSLGTKLTMLFAVRPRQSVSVLAFSRWFSAAAAGNGSQKLWGGRFSKDTDANAVGWAESLTCDQEMVKEDIWGSMAHVTMLGESMIMPDVLQTLSWRGAYPL